MVFYLVLVGFCGVFVAVGQKGKPWGPQGLVDVSCYP